ncbi:putative FAD-dependent isoamyl alcohol oxidase [Pseudomassariella vexata]|uniref:Putative FAD-dependent isoamyl alcohol oxidase n=1 Tax=Pseudomassariella vexata TaxID=1141098 RepID=A0A1Y2EK82_9PEZI|nr:putative FAD-dependent isoamyl alcohol oxidase [Pseudomassariella vexata]ORY71963.1 putative FAD-dependent isoamyl alcohol oxidase [Pseudomassariella vexata]
MLTLIQRPGQLGHLLSGLAVLFFVPAFAKADHVTPAACRYIPGDDGYPTQSEWAQLNNTVGGRLIATIPQASVCHTAPSSSDYNETACEALQAGWDMAQTFLEVKPAEIINAYYQNQSCDPFTPVSRPCVLGNLVSHSINVSSAEDVIAGLEFARQKNVRLAIKTTGHDYMGKSTGLGGLALWMYNLKTADVIDQYESAWYSGPAIKLGSGMIVGESYEVAAAAGYRLVGGECGSVGITGGYSQGGGHSILNTAYGMAADNVLEWEVVTATGEHLIATPANNTDLYWALCGGGGGTYGVVLSMKARLYPEGPVAGGTLGFNLADAENDDTFWEAVTIWHQYLPSFIKENNTLQWVIENSSFNVQSINLPDQPASAVKSLVSPYLSELDRLNITYLLTASVSATYLDHFAKYYGPLPYGPEPPSTVLNSRLVPRAVFANETARAKFVDAVRSTVSDGKFLYGCSGMDVSNSSHPDNAVLPAWRDTVAICIPNGFWNYTAPLAENIALKERLVTVHVPAIEAATPGSGVYLNEMDPLYQGDWKANMYAGNYDRLLSIKHQYDPDYLFYGRFAVGGDEFTIDGSGRLCRA